MVDVVFKFAQFIKLFDSDLSSSSDQTSVIINLLYSKLLLPLKAIDTSSKIQHF